MLNTSSKERSLKDRAECYQCFNALISHIQKIIENPQRARCQTPTPSGMISVLQLCDCVPRCVQGLHVGLHLLCVAVWKSEWDFSAETAGKTSDTARQCVWPQPSVLMCGELVGKSLGSGDACPASPHPTPPDAVLLCLFYDTWQDNGSLQHSWKYLPRVYYCCVAFVWRRWELQ